MGIFDALFGKKSEAGGAGPSSAAPQTPKFLRKEQNGGATYEVYKAAEAESARAFLLTKRVDKPAYYIVVETSEGNWGLDVKGLYLERLLPWQTELNSAQVDGSIPNLVGFSQFGLQMAARGINDNFVAEVQCGRCQRKWQDAVRYQKLTVVRCPGCKTLNKIDTGHISCVFV